jgi:predicted Rossmann fold nucleotide-binding protein DprA/Smf involved in DNA uptake
MHDTPNIAKGYFVTVRDRRQHIEAAVAAGRPTAEPTAWAALMGQGGMVVDAPADEPEPDEVLAALAVEPARAEDLIERTGLSRATIFRRLKAAETAGLAHSRAGVWHAGASVDANVGA